MENARRIIAEGGVEHPLNFLLDDNGQWRGRWPRQDALAVQAGHATSKFSGADERFFLEDATYNQMYSTPERQGHIICRIGIEIGGVPVELETARFWKQMGYLQDIDLCKTPRTWGW
jgi:hypothetical protein